jgi:hypothetical protein
MDINDVGVLIAIECNGVCRSEQAMSKWPFLYYEEDHDEGVLGATLLPETFSRPVCDAGTRHREIFNIGQLQKNDCN